MKYFSYLLLFFALVPGLSYAQENTTYIKGEVVEVLETTYPLVFGQEIEFQRLQVYLENGAVSNSVFNDYTPVRSGDTIYVTEGYDPDTDTEGFFVREIDRTGSMLWLFLIFAIVYIGITGMKGVRSLVALGISIAAVWFVLIPLLVAGHNPLLVGLLISSIILGLAIFITHGWNIVSISSYVGSLIAILVSMGFATYAISVGRISGLVGDESSTISVLYGSAIDLQGLLLAAMIIGILGVLDDVAIMQAAMVREFIYHKHGSYKKIFFTAMKVGREHAAALVNTLVLAYVAVALPLLLIVLAPANIYTGETVPFGMQLSNELFVTEFVRSIIGSFGLIITIPLVTILALVLFKKYPPRNPGTVHSHHH